MAPSWHQNRTQIPLENGDMNLCDIDLSPHMNTMQIIVNQYFVAFDAGCQILKEFKEMMAHQSALAAEGADEHDQYWELVWANLGCGLTMITGFCTAINPIDFTIWTSIVLLIGMMIGILLSSLFRFFTSYTFDGRSNLQNLLLAKESSQHHYPMEMDHICYDKIRRRSPDKEQ